MKTTTISIITGLIIISGLVWLATISSAPTSVGPANNVTIVDGRQIIEIQAKGGYQPRVSVAKAGLPTILRFKTKGTFDCSTAVRIPSLNLDKNLPLTGETDLDLGQPKVGVLAGTCGMGMYPFSIDFQA
ncbi:MAG: cupredoxin domain-containing protein [Patescibacteria group bacterium]